jgi:Zn-dependent peptidase ImmA (M78 family)
VGSLRNILGVSVAEFRAQNNVTDAFALLRAAAERAGVFVLLMGNLGTHHTNIDVRIFRGFALADKVAPFVVINEKDSRAAWSFTLLHELAHIWLGQTGISGYASNIEVERFCDAVAARYLLQTNELNEIGTSGVDLETLKNRINAFAGERNLSRKMVAYNLLRSNLITSRIYQSLSEVFDAERVQQETREDTEDGGPNYYVVRRHRIGPGLVRVVKRMVEAGALSTPKAGTVLGVKPTAVDRLVGGGRAA